MRNFIFVLSVCIAASAYASPRWACEAPRHEFGVRESTESVECDFVLKNTGEQALEFGRLYACCGVTAELHDRKLAPGEQTTLHAKLSLLLLKGDVSKVLYIATNDPVTPTCRLEIVGKVTPVLEIEPNVLMFAESTASASVDSANRLKPLQQTVRLRWKKPGAFAVARVSCGQKWLTAEAKDSGRPGEWELIVRTVSPVPPGVTTGYVMAPRIVPIARR